jgi:hypothetical protein
MFCLPGSKNIPPVIPGTTVAELIDRLIAAIAYRQHGNITRRQLLELGLSSTAISNRVRSGLLHPIFRGVYAVGTAPRSPVQRAAAAVLACGSHAALHASSAMALWGFWKRWDQPLEILVIKGDRRPRGIRVHRPRAITAGEITTQLGIRVTSPARTIFDITPRLNDKELQRDVNNALHSRFLTKSALAELLGRHPRNPATTRLRYFVTTEGGPTRSDWERAFPAFCERYGLPAPVMSLGAASHTPDASWPEPGIVIELDSWSFHNTRVDFETDRDRDLDYLVAGKLPIRITWERLEYMPEREAERLHKIVALRRRGAA